MSKRTLESSSDDDLPILRSRLMKSNGHGPTTKNLYEFSVQACEFCDKVFLNMYDLLVHNATHIMIPLRRESLMLCKQCNRYFATSAELKIHVQVHHFELPDILVNFIKHQPVVKCENTITDLLIEHNEKKLEGLIKMEAVVKCDNALTELIQGTNDKLNGYDKENALSELIQGTNEKLKGFDKELVVQCDDTFKRLMDDKIGIESFVKTDTEYILPDLPSMPRPIDTRIVEPDFNTLIKDLPSNGTEDKIKKRLIFEDDPDEVENDLINLDWDKNITDLAEDCDEICDLTLGDDFDRPFRSNKIMFGSKVSNKSVRLTNYEDMIEASAIKTAPYHIPSVHHDELVKETMVHECKRCKKGFSNRHNLIVHEATHLTLSANKRKTIAFLTRVCYICEQHVVGNHWTLKQHMEKHPFEVKPTHHAPKICGKCKLRYYNLARHSLKYHFLYSCCYCTKKFETLSELKDQHLEHCKELYNMGLVRISDYKQPIECEKMVKVCEICSLFLKTTQKQKYFLMGCYSENGKRIRCERCEKAFFEVKLVKMVSRQPSCYDVKRKPALTNEVRLKNIKQRLKMLKKISRF